MCMACVSVAQQLLSRFNKNRCILLVILHKNKYLIYIMEGSYWMRIAIIGCGAMGTILGAYMAKNGLNVELVDTYKEHVDALNESGARVTGLADFCAKVKAVTPEQMTGIYDLAIVLTKQNVNKIVLGHLKQFMDDNSFVCTLQNGVPEPYVAELIGKERTVGGATNWSATFVGPGVSELTTKLEETEYLFEIGEIDGSTTPRIQKVAEALGSMGTAHVTETLMASRWGKLVFNAAISGLSAVCGCTFGEVTSDKFSRACGSYIAREVKKCCEAEGYVLPPLGGKMPMDSLELKDQAMFDLNQRIWHMVGGMLKDGKASMLQDLEKGLVTEVREINGHVSKIGKEFGIPTPFNDKVVEIVTRIEKGEITYSMDNLQYFDKSLIEYNLLEI